MNGSSETATRLKSIAKYLLCLVAGASLSLAFPRGSQLDAAWFGLVPLLILLRFSKPREGFRYGFIFGLAFWMCSISWLMELRNNEGPVLLVAFGLLGLSVWCSLFLGLFGLVTSFLWQGGDAPTGGWRRNWFEAWRPLAVALLWCGAEYLRSTVFSGFAWNALGVSQATMLSIIQISSVGGVYAVSFVIVLLNGGVAGSAVRIWRNVRRLPDITKRHFDLMIALSVVLTVFVWGGYRVKAMRAAELRAKQVSIAAVNPDLPCIFVSNDEEWRRGYRTLSDHTKTAAMFKPDLIVWPETVLYDNMPNEILEADVLGFAEQIGAPILAGGTELRKTASGEELVYNSSFLFTTNNTIGGTYRKQHLVPFGEFVPFDKTLKILQKLAPAGVSCTPGSGPVVLDFAGVGVKASPLICFEDTVSDLSRAAVKAGAQLLIAQSNDAWFYGSSEAKQHHAQAVFRAVENGVSMVRCSNRGVTAVVTAYGLSTDDASGGFFSQQVAVPTSGGGTIYTKVGDWIFGIPCALLFGGFLVVMGKKRWSDERSN